MQTSEALSLLELSGELSATKIIQAYHRLAKKYHPDLYNTFDETIRSVMQEKFIQLGAAKDLLLQSIDSYDNNKNDGHMLEQDLINVEVKISRRQFKDALLDISNLFHKYGKLQILMEMRISLLMETEQYNEAYSEICNIESMGSHYRENPDFMHVKSVVAAQAGAYSEAHKAIDSAIRIINRPCPIYIAQKATIYILQGDNNNADSVIETLAQYDQTHPLVQQRKNVMNIGGQYIGKKEAATGACILCVILELIIDCI